jgi:hypothetical protein
VVTRSHRYERSPDKDQQLGSAVAGRDPTVPAGLSSSIELASVTPGGGPHPDRRIDFSAICFCTLLHLVAAEIHI